MSLFQILKSVFNSQIYVLFQILKSASKFSNLWPFLTFSNRCPMTSLTYALTWTLINKSSVDLRIWKERWFENTLISDILSVDADLRSGSWFKYGHWSESIIYIIRIRKKCGKSYIYCFLCFFSRGMAWWDYKIVCHKKFQKLNINKS
jgi:hypothetical protein